MSSWIYNFFPSSDKFFCHDLCGVVYDLGYETPIMLQKLHLKIPIIQLRYKI